MLEFFLVGNLSGDLSEIKLMEEFVVQTQMNASTHQDWMVFIQGFQAESQ